MISDNAGCKNVELVCVIVNFGLGSKIIQKANLYGFSTRMLKVSQIEKDLNIIRSLNVSDGNDNINVTNDKQVCKNVLDVYHSKKAYQDDNYYLPIVSANDIYGVIIIVLNDNNMSISENVGGMANYLGHLRTDSKYY